MIYTKGRPLWYQLKWWQKATLLALLPFVFIAAFIWHLKDWRID